jgi:hypothetical protein
LSINPLVLIQLPSSAADKAKRDYVTTFLKKQGELKLNQQKNYLPSKEKMTDWVYVSDVF